MRYAVLIGCNDYDHLSPLRCPTNDVTSMRAVLNDGRIGGFFDVRSLSEGELAANVLEILEELLTSTVGPDDMTLIYFSGHGKLDTHGRLYLAVKATTPKALDASSISMDRLNNYVGRSRCTAVIWILDCCYSGAVGHIFGKGGVDDAFASSTQGRGLSIMTSSTDLQISHEKEGELNSVFTKYLVEGLATGNADLDNDGNITVDEAFTYTYNSVKGTGLQNPMKFNLDVQSDLVLARNVHYNPLPIPHTNKGLEIRRMVEMLHSTSHIRFEVVLSRYFMEGEPYQASTLTASQTHTPNIRQTQNGFECDAFFSARALPQRVLTGKEVVNGRVKVRMEVKSDDVIVIVGPD